VNANDIIKVTGQHLLFLGVTTYSWQISQFQDAARFARSHGVDSLLVKVADGTNVWYGGLDGYRSRRDAIKGEGVGVIPYTYSYGNQFGALDTEINILTNFLQEDGVVCADMEVEWNGQTTWATHLASRMQPVPGLFLVSTWADPSLQNWQGVIRALAPAAPVFMPQQYTSFLGGFWGEFAANGASFLQPTVQLSQDFGPNDPVALAAAAHSQGHIALSVWYYDTALNDPRLLDAVFAAFPKGPIMNSYGPNSSDFNQFFTVGSGNWTCKQFGTVLLGSNLALYQKLSIDGNTLPVIGLPRTNELYQHDPNGYNWSVQFFERGCIVYDPQHVKDHQPGTNSAYLGKIEQFITLDPEYHPPTITKIPDAIIADIKQLVKDADL